MNRFQTRIREVGFFVQSKLDKYVVFNNDRYTRILIEDTNEYQIVMMCWKRGHITPIHDHNYSGCWMTVLKGCVQEKLYSADTLEHIQTHWYKYPDLDYIDNMIGFHQIESLDDETVTLHLYAPPIRELMVYDPKNNTSVIQNMTFDVINNWSVLPQE